MEENDTDKCTNHKKPCAVAAYLTFASNTAGMEAAFLAVTGAHDFQWMKLCNRFHRFCYQVGGAFLCGYAAFFALLLISFISAFNLFRHYSPNHFLRLKSSNNNK
ncbi:CASP-like protein 2C1 [Cucumis melo var. makuwa]|uniref:CASP-like protein n=1 Tax=Cucumis melo var. makuwa TaxID=1194695 RepID=A0A5D3CHU5_CUCMM|nr:CASP-like protein 2C1 [Cucumis melo var. makuwa]